MEDLMKVLRRNVRFLGIFLIVLMLIATIPCQSVMAALIDTESVQDSVRGREARDQLKQLFAREDVQAALMAHGIDPVEAKRRIDALSDEEVIRIADEIDRLPAGGNTFLLIGAILLAAMLVWYIIILLAVQATDN
jgi:hypothetical protein